MSLKIPHFYRNATTENSSVSAVVITVPPDTVNKYQLYTEHGIIDRLYPGGELNKLPETIQLSERLQNWRTSHQSAATVTLHSVAQKISTAEFVAVKCGCKRGCDNDRCRCIREKVGCTVHCHSGSECSNLCGLKTHTELALKRRIADKETESDNVSEIENPIEIISASNGPSAKRSRTRRI